MTKMKRERFHGSKPFRSFWGFLSVLHLIQALVGLIVLHVALSHYRITMLGDRGSGHLSLVCIVNGLIVRCWPGEQEVMIIIITTALKEAIQEFFTLSTLRHELSPSCTLKWPVHNHVQITCYLSTATWCEGTISYQVWQSWNRIYFSFILLAETIYWWKRGGNQSTRRKPLTTSFGKCHILKPENSSPNEDSNPHSSIGGRLGKQTC